jgi:hypothetical protein
MSKPSHRRERRGAPAQRRPETARNIAGAASTHAGQYLAPSVVAAFLIKLAKHMALLACLIIAGSATGRATVSQLSVFLLVAAAAALFALGRSLERRSPEPVRTPGREP